MECNRGYVTLREIVNCHTKKFVALRDDGRDSLYWSKYSRKTGRVLDGYNLAFLEDMRAIP